MVDLQRHIDRGTAWVALASLLVGGLDLASNLICLWLWVSPADLGTATLASATFPVVERLAGLGLGVAAVRLGPADRRALSSIFWLGLAASLVVLVGAVLAAPLIGSVFAHPIIGSLVCAYAVKLVVQTVYLVPEALLRHEMRFRPLAIIRVFAMLADSAAKLFTAYLGAHGHPALRIWCFVIGPLAAVGVTALGVHFCRPWRPELVFDRRAARAAVGFGAQVSLAELLYFAYVSADYVVIGRCFGDAAVGVYRLAYELVLDLVRLISMITAEVAYPLFARLAGDPAAAGEQLLSLSRRNLIVIAPCLVFLAVGADDMLAVLYPPLGPAAATAARILCIVGALRTLSFLLPPMLAGLGHARDALLYNALAAIVLPAAFVVGATGWPELGYLSVAWAWAVAYPLVFLVLLRLALVRTRLPAARYLRGVAGVLVCAALAALAALAVHTLVPAIPLLRLSGVAAATLAVYAFMLARIEGVSLRVIWRGLRG